MEDGVEEDPTPRLVDQGRTLEAHGIIRRQASEDLSYGIVNASGGAMVGCYSVEAQSRV